MSDEKALQQALRESIAMGLSDRRRVLRAKKKAAKEARMKTGEGAVPPPSPSREELRLQRDELAGSLRAILAKLSYTVFPAVVLDPVLAELREELQAAEEALRKAGRL